MSPVSLSPFHFTNANFVRVISRKFADGRFLIIGASAQEVRRQFAEAKREASVMLSTGDLATNLGPGEATAHFETAVWFYSSGENDDNRIAEALSRCADRIVLLPGPGAEAARRRLQLVQCFERFGLLPDYECDLMELDPGALCLRRQPSVAPGALMPAVEVAFVRLNKALSDLKGSLQIRSSELEGAHRHIAALEEKLLKLKEYRRELKLLKEQKRTMRKSPERRVGQVLRCSKRCLCWPLAIGVSP